MASPNPDADGTISLANKQSLQSNELLTQQSQEENNLNTEPQFSSTTTQPQQHSVSESESSATAPNVEKPSDFVDPTKQSLLKELHQSVEELTRATKQLGQRALEFSARINAEFKRLDDLVLTKHSHDSDLARIKESARNLKSKKVLPKPDYSKFLASLRPIEDSLKELHKVLVPEPGGYRLLVCLFLVEFPFQLVCSSYAWVWQC